MSKEQINKRYRKYELKKFMTANRKFIKIDSFEIAYRKWGTEGKSIVLLHNIPSNSILWNITGEYLSKKSYCVLAPELSGMGYTSGSFDYNHFILLKAWNWQN
jgi:pimeloyl-ACP methyl ester carboxylesterase